MRCNKKLSGYGLVTGRDSLQGAGIAETRLFSLFFLGIFPRYLPPLSIGNLSRIKDLSVLQNLARDSYSVVRPIVQSAP